MLVALLIGYMYVEIHAVVIPVLDTSSDPTYTKYLDMPISNSCH